MNTPLVQLSFALPPFEDPLSAAMGHSMEYEQFNLHADHTHSVTLKCVLPDDAHTGDIISLSATSPHARNAQYFSEKILQQTDLDNGFIHLSLTKITTSHGFVMQLMLHGKHATLKESMQFDLYIKAFEQGYIAPDQPVALTKPYNLRHYFSNIGSTLLSFF